MSVLDRALAKAFAQRSPGANAPVVTAAPVPPVALPRNTDAARPIDPATDTEGLTTPSLPASFETLQALMQFEASIEPVAPLLHQQYDTITPEIIEPHTATEPVSYSVLPAGTPDISASSTPPVMELDPVPEQAARTQSEASSDTPPDTVLESQRLTPPSPPVPERPTTVPSAPEPEPIRSRPTRAMKDQSHPGPATPISARRSTLSFTPPGGEPVPLPRPANPPAPPAQKFPPVVEQLLAAQEQTADLLATVVPPAADLPTKKETVVPVEPEAVRAAFHEQDSSAPVDRLKSTATELPEQQVPAGPVIPEPQPWRWPEICDRLLQFTGSGFAELGRQLLLAGHQGRKVLGFVSHVRETGRTSVLLALARVLSQEPTARVLIVDADFERARLAELVGVDPRYGLWEGATQPLDLALLTQRMTPGNVSLLPLCQPISETDWKRAAPGLRNVLQSARKQYDLVLINLGVWPVSASLSESWFREPVEAVITIAREQSLQKRGTPPLNYPDWNALGIESLGVIETFA